MTIGIYLPTYRRPHKLAEVAKNIEDTTHHDFKLYFGLEPEDEAGIDAAIATGHRMLINMGRMGYADTIQTIYDDSDEEIFIHANDDFTFLPDWDKQPVAMFENPNIHVVGVKEQENTTYSAVFFIRRKYIEEQSGVIDIPDRVFYPYHHNYQDTEFTQTAQARGVWAKCEAPCIQHNHPGIVGGQKDATYKKNDATVSEDERTFESRKHLWRNM
jgi:hypothetical protein